MENFDRIQQYLFNTMTTEERASFEEEVRIDTALAEELEIQRFEAETIDQLEEDSLRKKAKVLRTKIVDNANTSDNIKPLKNTRFNRLTALSIAASIVLIAGYFFQIPNDATDYITYGYAEARLDYGNQLLKGSDGDESIFLMPYTEILKKRDDKKVDQAISYFENFGSESSSDMLQAQLNLGHAYILGKQFHKAIPTFSLIELSNDASPKQIEEAMLFKAISYIALDKKSEAISILEELTVKGKNFDVLAQNVLSKLDL